MSREDQDRHCWHMRGVGVLSAPIFGEPADATFREVRERCCWCGENRRLIEKQLPALAGEHGPLGPETRWVPIDETAPVGACQGRTVTADA